MDPIKLITYMALAGVVTLITMGAAGFYIGYSAGRKDLREVKAYLANFTPSPPPAAPAAAPSEGGPQPIPTAVDLSKAIDYSPVITEIRSLSSQLKKIEKFADASEPVNFSPVISEIRTVGSQVKRLDKPSPAAPDFSPILTEVRALGESLKRLEKAEQQNFAALQQNAAAADKVRDDPKLREELGRLRQVVSSATEQLNVCQAKVASLESRSIPQSQALPQTAAQPQRTQSGEPGLQAVAKSDPQSGQQDGKTVVLYDSFYLKKDQNKAFSDIDLTLALQGVASRSARVDINRQAVSIAFGERKEIVYNNITCELNLMETDLGASQARFSIACKR